MKHRQKQKTKTKEPLKEYTKPTPAKLPNGGIYHTKIRGFFPRNCERTFYSRGRRGKF